MKTRPSLPAALLAIPAAYALVIEDIGQINGFVTGDSLPKPGQNVDGTSVFQNYYDAYTNGQFFLKTGLTFQYESPSSDIVLFEGLFWCSNLHFTDFKNGEPMGYTARCVFARLVDPSGMLAAGAQLSEAQMSSPPLAATDFVDTHGFSAVYVPQTNVFEYVHFKHTDNYVNHYWDDGRSTIYGIGWEVHDEGDLSPNAGTSAFSAVAKLEIISAEETAMLLNTNSTNLTPEAFRDVFANVWIKAHEVEAATKNPNPEAELEAVEQVKEELNQTGTEEVAGTDTEVGNSSPGTGRKLARAASGAVSVALRFLGV